MGFVGSNLAKELSKNSKVIVIDDLSTGKKKNLKSTKNIEIVFQKIQNLNEINIFGKIDGIFHFAAQPSVPLSIKNQYESTKNNVLSSLKIFDIAKKFKSPVIFASSSAIYGNLPAGSDKLNKFDILSPYALDKLHLEYLAKLNSKLHSISCIGLRFFNIYGPNQDETNPYSGVIPKFINLALNNKKLTINGGYQTRDFIYIDDVIKICNSLMMYLLRNKKPYYDIFNVGTCKQISINQLVRLISKKLEKKLKMKKIPLSKSDPIRSLGHISKIKKFLKIKNNFFTDFDTGLTKTIDFYGKN